MSNYASPEEYNLADLLCCAASREVQDNEIVFAGTGLPMVAIMLAQRTHAPNLKLIFEAGTLDGRPPELPTSVGDARCETGASRSSGLYDAFSIAQRGYVDLGFLGGAEVDQFGNVNTTCSGNYREPDLRLTGSGGNPDINSFARRTVFIMVHEKRRFVENELPGLDLGDVEDVVDDVEQVLAAFVYVLGVFAVFRRTDRTEHLVEQDFGKAQDGVERRTDFVAHSRQKAAFSFTGGQRLFGSSFQLQIFSFQQFQIFLPLQSEIKPGGKKNDQHCQQSSDQIVVFIGQIRQ